MNDGRALALAEVEAIQKNMYRGCFHDEEIHRLFQTILVLRGVCQELIRLFKVEPLRRVSTADPVPNSQLAHFRELAALEDQPCQP